MDWVVPLFPVGSLAESVITTVWLGTFVIVFFNEWLGWPLSGLIVPGYLVPLMILQPTSATVIVVEATVTYAIAYGLFTLLPRTGWWFSVFGRDRFFFLVLLSVIVRIIFDAWLLPAVGDALTRHFDLAFQYRNQLHSVGLIIVALMANQFWKPGLQRGLLPVLCILFVTYVLVRFILLPYTNFTISSIAYLYEDVAGSIFAAPKTYIILLTAAFLASRMNLLYGWEFNGILIPSLLALLWYQPLKLAVSFAETFVVLGLAHLVLALPMFRGLTIEGGRKLLLFFNISFAYKMALGFTLNAIDPSLKVTDFFGFGYLITTLLAIKMHDKGIALKMTRATLQISLVSALVANLLGYALTWLPRPEPMVAPSPKAVPLAEEPLAATLRREKLGLYRAQRLDDLRPPTAMQCDRFRGVLTDLQSTDADGAALRTLRDQLAALGFDLHILEERYFLLTESGEAQGHGLFVVDSRADSDLLITVPAPLDEWMTMESAVLLMERFGARALAVNTVTDRLQREAALDPMNDYQSFITVFFQVFGRHQTLQVRGLIESREDQMPRDWQQSSRDQGVLFVKASLPRHLSLTDLGALTGPLHTVFADSPLPNLHRDMARDGFAALFLTKSNLRSLLSKQLTPQAVSWPQTDLALGRIRDRWLDPNWPAGAGSEAYVGPALEQLWYLDEEVFQPLVELVQRADTANVPHDTLRIIARSAATLGLELRLVQDGGAHYLVVDEGAAPQRFWGGLLVRLGPARPYMVQVPRPLQDRHTIAFGFDQFHDLHARLLLVHGAHPYANASGLADVTQPNNRLTFFNQASQSFLRAFAEPHLLLQIRAMGYRDDAPSPTADILLASHRGVTGPTFLTPLEQGYVQFLEQVGFDVGFVDGRAQTAGYSVGGNPQAAFIDHEPSNRFFTVWVAARLRRLYAPLTDPDRVVKQLAALDIPTHRQSIGQVLQAAPPPQAADQSLLTTLTDYLRYRDILALQTLHARPDLKIDQFPGPSTRGRLLLIRAASGAPLVLANLDGRLDGPVMIATPDAEPAVLIDDFLRARRAVLHWQVPP